MSYPAAQLRQDIWRRLNGRCRIDLPGGKAMSFGGDRLADHNSCADCQESCGSVNATGLLFNDLNFELDARKGEACLRWACPGCGKGVTEPTSLLSATDAAREIAADPLCHTCRTGTAR